MFRKNYFTFLFVAALFLISGMTVSAQYALISGRVELTKADGTKVPVAGALIEVFRMDQKAKLPTDKTDKKGNFAFAGVALGGRYVLAVSGAGIAPAIYPNVSPGMDNIVIAVSEGDGKRRTEEEVKQALTSRTNTNTTANTTQTTAVSADDKKREEEIKKQNEKILAEQEKVKNSNEVAQKSLVEGNKALDELNYDLAITKFEEGYNTNPAFAPRATIFLSNLAVTYIRRAEANYKTLKTDNRASVLGLVKNDSQKAAEKTEKILEILKTATPTDESQRTVFATSKLAALKNRKNAYYLMIRTGADRTKGKEAIIAYEEYLASETDVAEKTKTQLIFADVLLDVQENERAVTEYEKILATNPNNIDALAGAGFAMVNVAYGNGEDKAKFQLAANYLQKFFDAAPATHPRKEDAKLTLAQIKTDYKITPKK